MALHPIKYVFASSTTNKEYYTDKASIENGILYGSDVVSDKLNGIEEVNQYAIRELQTIGGYYDNNQIYNRNNIVFVLVNDNNIIKKRVYVCNNDNITGKPPISGTSSGKYNDVDVIDIGGYSFTEDTTNWSKVDIDNSRIVKYNTSGKSNYRFFSLTSENKGYIKIRTYSDTSSSTSVTMSFDVYFCAGKFKIKNVIYSDSVRKSNNRFNSIYIGHPGFALFLTSGYFGISINDDTFIKRIEIDYEGASFFNSAVTKITFNDSDLYAIREDGGSYINNLGDIYHSLRNNVTASNGDTYDFFLFSRGCIPFSTAIVLNSTYYHQWANGGMPSVNIDVSDSYLVNKGVVMGQVNGVKYKESLPNIKSRTGNTYELGSNQQPAHAMNMSGEAYSQYGNSMGNGWQGAFYAESERPNDVGFQSGLNFYATDQVVANGNYYQLYLKFDASRSSPVYQDDAPVRGKCLVTTFLLQAF